MTRTLVETLETLPPAAVMRILLSMVDEMANGKDETVAALRSHAEAVGARILLVGGAAVIVHGYRRTTDDRDFLVHHRQVRDLAERLMDDPDWERLVIRQYAFVYRPTGVQVDFLVSGDLIQWGRPYYFPDPEQVETVAGVEGIAAIGLHELMFLKLLADRMQDLADIMELVKRHQGAIDPQRVVARLEKEDDDLREKFMEILRQAPIELANERRFGQQNVHD
jgi:hypothetical protein